MTKRQIAQDEVFIPQQSRVSMTAKEFLAALYDSSCYDATHCVNFTDEDDDASRVWARDVTHAEMLAVVLKNYGFTDIEIEEV